MPRFEKAWAVEMTKSSPDLFRAQLAALDGGYGRFLRAICFYMVEAVLQLLPILALRLLVSHFETTSEGKSGERLARWQLWALVALLYLAPTVGSLCRARYDVEMVHAGCEMWAAASIALYKKSLKVLSPEARKKFSTGQVVNYFSSDAAVVQRILLFIGVLFSGPLQIGLCLFFISRLVGEAVWIGLAFMIGCVPLQVGVLVVFLALQKRYLQCSDARTKLMNEILNGVRIIKFLAWERPFIAKIRALRAAEARVLLRQTCVISIGFSCIMLGAPLVQPVIIFSYYTQKMGRTLDASTAFSTLALFSILRLPLAFLPFVLISYLSYKISCQRIVAYLTCRELDSEGTQTKAPADDAVVAKIADATFSWDGAAPPEDEDKKKKKNAASSSSSLSSSSSAKKRSLGEEAEEEERDALEARKKRKKQKQKHKKPASKKQAWGFSSSSKKKKTTTTTTTEEVRVVDVEVGVVEEECYRVTLRDVSVEIRKGALVGVVGPVGSGKSSLVSAFLGEIELLEGTVFARRAAKSGSIAYAAQVPWVINETLKNNILFGLDEDSARFDACLESCALRDDVAAVAGGVDCEIGERGINLSGGQKARVALARVAYSRAHLALLDDPLSAVDSHVCRHLIDHVICGPPETAGSLGGRTRVLVTHHAAVLPRCDLVLVMGDGRVTAQGTYDDLSARGVEMGELLAPEDNTTKNNSHRAALTSIASFPSIAAGAALSTHTHALGGRGGGDPKPLGPLDELRMASPGTSPVLASGPLVVVDRDEALLEQAADPTAPRRLSRGDVEEEEEEEEEEVPEKKKTVAHKLVESEKMVTGTVSMRVFGHFFRAGGYLWIFAALTFMLGGKAAELGGQFYLAGFSQRRDPKRGRILRFVNYYLAFSLIAVAGLALRALSLGIHRVRSSNVIHSQLVERVLRAPVTFFDVTPVGRILNRFGADMLTIDTELSRTMSEFTATFMYVAGAIVAITVATRGIFLILAVPLILVYRKIDTLFRSSSTAISRLTKLARSPVVADFSETLNGVATVRAFDAEDRFIARLSLRMDALQSATAAEQQAFNWLSIRLDQLAATTACAVGALAVASNGSLISAEWLGLALMASVEVSTFLKSMVRLSALLAGNMASVERLLEYIGGVPQEKDLDNTDGGGSKKKKKQSSYVMGSAVVASEEEEEAAAAAAASLDVFVPTRGEIVFEAVEMRYRPGLPLVLRQLSFQVEGGSKVGIVGRTGSGKSSIANALWRLVGLESGAIVIDGVDTSTLTLFALRRACFIIPQDPVLFTATLRFNLDPFGEYTMEEICAALERARMADFVLSLAAGTPNHHQTTTAATVGDGLNYGLQEGGSNLSVGQRQLICIARAMLRSPKIVMLDEATASIDNETDAQVQLTLRETFAQSTTLTIAHRLHTILDADAILVLSDGQVVENGTPQQLLQDEGSHFAAMNRAAHERTPSSQSLSTMM